MPQETNLNVSPYFDDFDKDKNFKKVLFKPGTPVQARELSTLQSILQDQIEQFGVHFFKEGSKVIPGNLTYNNTYQCIQIESTYLSVPISLYLEQLVGKRISGERSGVTAQVISVLTEEESERGIITLYLNYESSSTLDNESETFLDGESLITLSDITYGMSVISANEPFANTIASGASQIGTAMSVGEGVYFARGAFVQVPNETLILDQYSQAPTYRIGFQVSEEIITSNEDESLNDNASGFTNFAAPGADRFKISLTLAKKDINDIVDPDFIEIARVQQGTLQTFVKETNYNLIRDAMAKRTYDESGDYCVNPFEVFMKESLNDQVGNKGLFTDIQTTPDGNVPSENLMIAQVSPGKAYIKGYDIETIAPTLIDVSKARTTKSVEQEPITYVTGNPIFVNNVFGSPAIGIGTTATVSLISSRRKGETSLGIDSYGEEVGLARLYDFKAQSASYVNSSTIFESRLFDVKLFTKLQVGTAITSITASDYIEGARSGAGGFVRTAGTNVTELTLSDVNGQFLNDENIIINGNADGRTITKITDFNIDDVKSMRSYVGVSTFEADLILDEISRLDNVTTGSFEYTKTSSTTGIITATGGNFAGILTTGNILSYSLGSSKVPQFNRVTGVSTTGDEVSIAAIPSIPNINNGSVSSSNKVTITDLRRRDTTFAITENTLTTPVNKPNVESLDVTTTNIQLRKQYSDITVANSGFTSPAAGKDLFFQPFDEERYLISYDDGSIEPLTPSQFTKADDSKTVTFTALSKSSGKANLFATVLKSNVRNKSKLLNEANVLVINRSKLASSGIGTNTLNDGLTNSRVYGTRVQDRQISLNVPEAIELLGVFESNDASDPDLPGITLGAYSGPSGNNSDMRIGEKLIGIDSDAVAVITEKPNTTTVGAVFLNENTFSVGERVRTSNTNITAIVAGTTPGDRNVTNQYFMVTNDKDTYYDYSYLERDKNAPEPSNRLKIVFKNLFVEASDEGDFYTASSYPSNLPREIIPINGFYDRITSDLIDIRPRVSNYNTSSSVSPFDFSSRSFASTGSSINDPMVSDEQIIVDYEYYQGRRDRLFLDKDGKFLYVTGFPSDDPTEPEPVKDAIEVCKVEVPPYVYNVKDVTVRTTEHKRYTMKDIGGLEQRIENIEFYTQLSLLETETSNLQVVDANGLNRFKSGFFVDNFKSHDSHHIAHVDFSASIDRKEGILRPGHYTTAIDLIPGSASLVGIGTSSNPNVDLNFVDDIDGLNIRKTGSLITLDYEELVYFRQPYASRVENCTPFLVIFYEGDLELTPNSDTWVATRRVNAQTVNQTAAFDAATAILGVNAQTGLSEVDWGAWETTWTGERVVRRRVESTTTRGAARTNVTGVNFTSNTQNTGRANVGARSASGRSNVNISLQNSRTNLATRTTTTTTRDTFRIERTMQDIETTTRQSRNGIQFQITPTTNRQSIGDRILSRDIVPFMRSRSIQFSATKMKPLTRIYGFFDGVNVTRYMTPKLLEISMTSGRFRIGETVFGYTTNSRRTGRTPDFIFRICAPNHKDGPFNSPTNRYGRNPYANAGNIPADYSTSSTILNVDTFSLAAQAQGQFRGQVSPNMILEGRSSGAQARVSNIRFITDSIGKLQGTFQVPDPDRQANPRWETGTKTLKFTTSNTNSLIAGTVTSSAESNFYAQGELQTVRETVLSTRIPQIRRIDHTEQRVQRGRITRQQGPDRLTVNTETLDRSTQTQTAAIDTQRVNNVDLNVTEVTNIDRRQFITQNIDRRQFVTNRITNVTNVTQRAALTPEELARNLNRVERFWQRGRGGGWRVRRIRRDPLAQTFTVGETTGVFVTSIDVFFQSKDETLPVILEMRTVETGLPTQKVLPFATVEKEPDDVSISEDGSVATRFTFRSPVYLNGETEYAVVLLSDATTYNAWIARMGEVDIATRNLPDAQQTIITQQPYLGSLFKSQNGGTWDPSQYEDLKMTLYAAQFTNSTGIARFYNPKLDEGNKQIITLPENPIKILSKKATVGLGTTFAAPAGFIPGVTVTQEGNLTASAKLINTAGIASVGTQTFSITNPGIGYTPSSGSLVYSDVPMVALTGSGSGMVANVTVNNGKISAVDVTNGGQNFAVGDTVGVSTLGLGNGSSAVLSVGIVTSTNTLILDNIQGTFNTGVGTITFDNGSSVVQLGAGVTITSFDVDSTNDGLHMRVSHRAHAMHAFNNRVKLSGVESDVPVTTLSADYNSDSTGDISVVSSANFDTFEGVGVGTTNHGYLKIGNEIIAYTGTASGSITGISTRGVDDTGTFTYESGTEIRKYEFGGVSLRRINKTHDMNNPNVTVPDEKDLDHYHIKLDMSSNGTDRSGASLPDRFFTSTKQSGGDNITATQNIQFETITPNIQILTPPGTSVSGRVRTISATSVDGSEESFIDQGFESVDLGGQNHFDTPRLIASEINEIEQLDTLPANKSFTLENIMVTTDLSVSPVIDLDRVNVCLTTNRINSPVSNFATDPNVRITGQDPCASTYVSKLIVLENPASEIKVNFAAYRRNSSDIRVFFKTLSEGSTENSMNVNFTPFPGTGNFTQGGTVRNSSASNGLPDALTTASTDFGFKDYEFTTGSIPRFTKFQIKIDMVGTNQAEPPYIKDLRAIALA
mgnify:CR=1 FL=1